MQKLKKIWFVFIMVILALPMMQNLFEFCDQKPLNGAFIPAIEPEFSLKSVWNETYQDSITKYVEENIGFHNSLVRLNNQFIFSIFRESPIKGPVLGKDGMFFERTYIISYLGETYIGEEQINETSYELKIVQEILETKGISLINVFPPSKASYYPELIPNSYKPNKKTINNYEAYIKSFDENNINLLDFNKYFLEIRDTCTKTIYCDLGAHWTIYASSIAIDSIINYLENITGKKHADFSITKFETPDTLRNQDNDLYKTMNLLFLPQHNNVEYPVFKFNNGEDKYRPKVLAISDSYWWTVYAHNVALPQNLFSDGGFWFYNKTIYPVRYNGENVNQINYKQEIDNQEFVLLVTTEATNHLYPYGFTEKYLEGYAQEFVAKKITDSVSKADSLFLDYRAHSVDKIIKEIHLNEEWKLNILMQAEEQGVDLETMIYRNAEYTFKMKMGIIK